MKNVSTSLWVHKYPKAGQNTQQGYPDCLTSIHSPINWSHSVFNIQHFGPVTNFPGPVNGTGPGS